MRYESDGQSGPRQGLILLQVLIVGLFCVFALRLWFLQVHKGGYYAEKAMDNRLRQEAMYAPRGLIRDRDGHLVAVNEPAYALGLVREDCRDVDATLEKVSQWTGVDTAILRETYEKGRKRVKSFEPLILVSDLPFNLLARIEAGALRWPGLEIMVRPKRHYPQGDLLSHVLGYVAEASESELEKDARLAMGDTVGKRGLEYVLEPMLRGDKGLRQLEVDAAGRRMNELILKDPEAGNNLRLSIDLGLQEKAVKELLAHGRAGSVVVMEPYTGQLLAMVSEPSFDNNAFAVGLSSEQWIALRDNPEHPLQNRAYQSVYPPGSVFKLVVASTVLAEGLVDPKETVYCPGHMRLGNHVFRCWKKRGHGKMDMHDALVQSCDVYFYEMGKRLGVDRIEAFAKASGFSAPTGVDLPHEKSGLIPDRQWKLRRFGERWQGGENLNLAIGQGYTLVSPLQVARFVSAVVNGGKLMKPLLVATDKPLVRGELPLSEDKRLFILQAMRDTVEKPHGTAWRLRTRGAIIGGKTGTAQVVKLVEEKRGAKTEEIEYRFRDHAWIASWGFKDGRAVVIVTMVEHGGHGSESAVPVTKALYDYIFGKGEAEVPTVPNWPLEVEAEPNAPVWPVKEEG